MNMTIFGEPNGVSSVGNPYMFTGRNYDSETGLYYYRARYYSPYIGRFLQTDPIGYEDGLNLYTYVQNNPIIAIDPMGTIASCPDTPPSPGDTTFCYDWANPHPAHWGQRCYREVISIGSGWSGVHCCYRGRRLVDEHRDWIDPAVGGGGGYCRYDRDRICAHIIVDIVIPRIIRILL
jgi:RHS repeat-associated protein